MNRFASVGLLFLGIAALGLVGLLWFERIPSNGQSVSVGHQIAQKDSERTAFFETYTLDELKQFDLYYGQYPPAPFAVRAVYENIEWIKMKVDVLPTGQFADPAKEVVRQSYVAGYLDLQEAYQAKLDSFESIGFHNTIAAVSGMAKADTKIKMSALRYLMALLAYEKLLKRESRWDNDLTGLIGKYRQITGFSGEFTEN